MAGTIKGITVKIGADTTQLNNALKSTNKTIASTQKELKAINEGLKFNPKSTELLRQKQETLAKAVDETSKKLGTLKEAQKQASDQLARGEIGIEQYNALNREIIKTENQLARLTRQSVLAGNTGESASKKMAFGFSQASQKLASMSTSLEGLSEKFSGISKASASALAGIVALSVKAGSTADDINTLAKQTGLTTEEIQKFQYASELIDVSLETLTGSMARNIRAMRSASSGTGATFEAYKSLGVAVTDANGQLRDSHEVYYESIKALGEMTNETERDAIAMQLFGRSAQELNPLILGGVEQLEALGDEAERLGLVLDQETLDSANAFKDSMDKIKATASATAVKIGASWSKTLVPLLQNVGQFIADLGDKFSRMSPTMQKAVLKILALGSALAPITLIGSKVLNTFSNIAKGLSNFALKVADGTSKVLKLVNALGGFSKIVRTVTPIGLYTTAMLGLGKATIEVSKALGLEVKDLEAHNQRLKEAKASTEALSQSQSDLASRSLDNYIGSASEIANIQRLKDSLADIVDSNGRVKEGYEAVASTIVSDLANATGVQISLNNGVIESWDEVANSIQNTIDKMKGEAIISAYADEYTEAIQNIGEAERNLAIARASYDDEFNRRIAQGYNEIDARYYAEQVSNLSEVEQVYRNYANTIAFIDSEQEAMAEGHYSEMLNIHDDYINKDIELQGASLNDLEAKLEEEQELYNGYYSEYLATGDRAFKDKAEQSEKNIELLQNEINRMKGITSTASTVGASMMTGIMAGIEAKRSELLAKLENVSNSMLLKVKDMLEIHSPSRKFKEIGKYTMLGLEEGIASEEKSLMAKMQDVALGMSGFSSSLSYAVGEPTTASSTDNGSNALVQALMIGLAQMGASIVEGMPNEININLDGNKLASASWSAFDTEANKRGRMFAPSQNEISMI